MIWKFKLFLLGVFLLPQLCLGSFVDKSSSIFLSRDLQRKVGDYQNFPIFWWNFLVADSNDDWEKVDRACALLKSSPLVEKASCKESPKDFARLLRDWAQDISLRDPFPNLQQLKSQFDSVFTQAGVFLGDRETLNIFRSDPFETWKDLKKKGEAKLQLKFERKNGFFFDSTTRRVIIPIQMAYAPTDVSKTSELLGLLKQNSLQWVLLGPHGSNFNNQQQVIKDVGKVSIAGTVLLLIFALTLFILGRGRTCLILIPVLLAMVISTFLTVFIYGSIHGIVLSFGTGIVGLALDYGLQAVFNARSPHVWRSNFFGLATTLVGLVILGFSAMPLLRQMMVFSVCGLCLTYLFFFSLFKKYPHVFAAAPLSLAPNKKVWKTAAAPLLILFSIFSLFTFRPTSDMSKLDYQDTQTRSVSNWLYKTIDMRPPLFSISNGPKAMTAANKESAFANSQKINLENLSNYVPTPEEQIKNASAWNEANLIKTKLKLDPSQQKFFEPFFETHFNKLGIDLTHPPLYLDHLHSQNRWISLWLPQDQKQEKMIRENFPEAISAREIVMEVPTHLFNELKWMAPLSIFGAGLILFGYYKRMARTFSALLPFLTGMGLVTVAHLIFRFEIALTTVIGLVMVFGFSIDYGIFATDLHRGLNDQSDRGVWTGLTLAVLTTTAGFIPLLFCQHPILLGLGQTLFFGTLGTYIGAVWGVPGLAGLLK